MLVTLLSLSGRLDVAARGAAIIRQELALRWLNRQQRVQLSNAVYGSHARYLPDSPHTHSGLLEFEQHALQYFPPPPARIFIGGSGSGREALAVVALGFTLAGYYDPSDELLTRCRRNLAAVGVPAEGWRGTHEDLITPVRGSPFDGCILGWGSYTHVLGRRARERLLQVLRLSSPEAPVLLSFLRRAPRAEDSRAVRVQGAIRALVQSLPGPGVAEDGDAYLQATGFVHLFTRQEIEAEATNSGYEVAHYEDTITYPHAVLLPKNRPPRAT